MPLVANCFSRAQKVTRVKPRCHRTSDRTIEGNLGNDEIKSGLESYISDISDQGFSGTVKVDGNGAFTTPP